MLSVLLYDKDSTQVLSQQTENLRSRSPRAPTPGMQAAASQLAQTGCRLSASAYNLFLQEPLAKGLNHSRFSLLTCDIGEARVSPKRAVHRRGQRLRVWELMSAPGCRACRGSPLPFCSAHRTYGSSPQLLSHTDQTRSPAEPFLSPRTIQ